MSNEVPDNPSVSEANKLLRVLDGVWKKYTCRLHYLDGHVLEFQSNAKPLIKWSDEARSLWLFDADYSGSPMTVWPEGAILLVEENPKA